VYCQCLLALLDKVLAGTRHVYFLLIITSINNRDRYKIRWVQLLGSTELRLAVPFICARNMSGLHSLSPANPRYAINPLKPCGHYMYRTVVTICTTSLTFTHSTFCPHGVFMCFVRIWEQTAIISLYSINWLVRITETECVYCAVRTECLNIM